MARDLHDVVAHNISVINVQANTALHLMDRQPERAREALTTINDVSKQALVELRSVLGVLRDVDGGRAAGTRARAWPASATWPTARAARRAHRAASKKADPGRCPPTWTSPPTGSSRRRSPTPPATPAAARATVRLRYDDDAPRRRGRRRRHGAGHRPTAAAARATASPA